MQRMFKVLAVAVLVATVLAISSMPAFARPLRGGLPLQKPELSQSFVCERLVEIHPLFVPKVPQDPPPEVTATCWHISRGPGLERASEAPPLR